MEEKSFREKNIVYSEYYCSEAAYVRFLKRHGITTIEQLLEGKFDGNKFNGYKMHGETTTSLRIFINFLKYKYLQEPLLMDAYLERVIDLEQTSFLGSRGYIEFVPVKNEENKSTVYKFLGGDFGNVAFGNFVSQTKMNNSNRVADNMPKKEVKMIDFFNWILANEDKYSQLVPYAKAYVASYTKDASLLKADSPTLQFLDNQLRLLLLEKANIDSQIVAKKVQIEEYKKNKGGSIK